MAANPVCYFAFAYDPIFGRHGTAPSSRRQTLLGGSLMAANARTRLLRDGAFLHLRRDGTNTSPCYGITLQNNVTSAVEVTKTEGPMTLSVAGYD
jgi:hypothetical protein